MGAGPGSDWSWSRVWIEKDVGVGMGLQEGGRALS
jgi:hypothetical protein